ncbi:MAG: hypothetical protein HY361_03155 [Candidatus Aenigmarchaeota archaeon]|nr:hypothetical protein [Candidatus Aenigmarchaeota archaeon]
MRQEDLSGKMQKDVFLRSAIITTIVFIIGISIGVWLDTSRVEEVQSRLTEIDTLWNDARLQVSLYGLLNRSLSCNSAIKANLQFNDNIFKEGQKLERYELTNRFAPSLLLEKSRYALLQTQFWFNSIDIKNNCNVNYSTLVYFYSYYNETVAIQQKVQSAVLLDVKEKCGQNVMLIPLPLDLNITTIDILKDNYRITKTPAILINENILLEGLQKENDLLQYLKC